MQYLYIYPVQEGRVMPIVTSYTDARSRFAALCNEAESGREPVIITRRGHPDVALVSAEELSSLRETAHLLRSPANARRLLESLRKALEGNGESLSIAQLQAKYESER